MIRAARLRARRKVPYFGICFGMQMAVIEATPIRWPWPNAKSTEFGATSEPVVGLMTEWLRGNELEQRQAAGDLGGTMRLGAYPSRSEPRQRDRRHLRRDRNLRAPPSPLRGQHQLPRSTRAEGHELRRPVARRPFARRRSNSPIIPGSSACSSIRAEIAAVRPHPLFASSSPRQGAEPARLAAGSGGLSPAALLKWRAASASARRRQAPRARATAHPNRRAHLLQHKQREQRGHDVHCLPPRRTPASSFRSQLCIAAAAGPPRIEPTPWRYRGSRSSSSHSGCRTCRSASRGTARKSRPNRRKQDPRAR